MVDCPGSIIDAMVSQFERDWYPLETEKLETEKTRIH